MALLLHPGWSFMLPLSGEGQLADRLAEGILALCDLWGREPLLRAWCSQTSMMMAKMPSMSCSAAPSSVGSGLWRL